MRQAIYGQAYTFYAPLPESNTTGKSRLNPVINAGDFIFIQDGVSLGNLTTIPDVFPVGGRIVRFRLTAAEMTCKSWMVQGIAIGGGSNWGDSFFAGETVNNALAQLPMYDSNVVNWKGTAAPNNTGDAFALLGTPSGASVSADIASVKNNTNSIVSKLPIGIIADNNSVDTVESTLSTILSNTDTVEAGIASIKADTVSIVSKLPSGSIADNASIDTVESSLSTIIANTDTLEAGVAAVKADTATTVSRLPVGTIAQESGVLSANTKLDNIVLKLPTTGSISNMDVDTTLIDGIALRKIYELMMCMADGKFVVDEVAGTVTFYKRNNSTVLTTVRPTTTGRTRL